MVPKRSLAEMSGLVQDLDLHLLKVAKGSDKNCYNFCILD